MLKNIEPRPNGSIHFKNYAVVTKEGEFYNNRFGKVFKEIFKPAIREHNKNIRSMVEGGSSRRRHPG
jgi:predicted transcriptional regulator YdeE